MPFALSFIEIPVSNMDRAVHFYEAVFGIELRAVGAADYRLMHFPGGFPGALAEGPAYMPGGGGTLVYLSGGKDLHDVLSRVAGAGGEVVQEKTFLEFANSFVARFRDSEGNILGLNSPE